MRKLREDNSLRFCLNCERMKPAMRYWTGGKCSAFSEDGACKSCKEQEAAERRYQLSNEDRKIGADFAAFLQTAWKERTHHADDPSCYQL